MRRPSWPGGGDPGLKLLGLVADDPATGCVLERGSVLDPGGAETPREVGQMARRFGLIGCSGAKLDHPAPAGELYRSPLFRASAAWIAPRVEAWAILSAAHGLVFPGVELDPYDRVLTPADAGQWGHNVARQLERAFPAPAELVVLAGRRYVEPWARRAGRHGFELVEPLAGLGIGERLRFLAAG